LLCGVGGDLLSLGDLTTPGFSLRVTREDAALEEESDWFIVLSVSRVNWLANTT
jgi:hypothetical protein